MWGVSYFRAVLKSHRVPSTPGPFGATLCKQERAFLKAVKPLLLLAVHAPSLPIEQTAPSYEGAKVSAGGLSQHHHKILFCNHKIILDNHITM